jgi:hypothetical protein
MLAVGCSQRWSEALTSLPENDLRERGAEVEGAREKLLARLEDRGGK